MKANRNGLEFARVDGGQYDLGDMGSIKLINTTAQILFDQWPRVSFAERVAWLKRSSKTTLPASWVLLDSGEAIGHVRLSTKYTEDSHASINEASSRDNISVVATSIVISQSLRGKGLGTILLDHMHACCRDLGFGRVVLWSVDAVKFYAKNGYKKINPLLKAQPQVITNKLAAKSLSDLQRVLLKKQKNAISLNTGTQASSGVDIVDNELDAKNSVWLAYRLRNSFGYFYRPKGLIESEINSFLDAGHHKVGKKADINISRIQKQTVFLHNVPFENQIGPMCGIAALNCLKAYFFETTRKPSFNHINAEHIFQKILGDAGATEIIAKYFCSKPNSTSSQQKSILEDALDENITTDGEMFDIKQMAKLSSLPSCGLNAVVFENISIGMILDLLVLGLPPLICYDRSKTSSIFGVDMNNGTAAHWGVIVGFVSNNSRKSSKDAQIGTNRPCVWLGSNFIIEHKKYIDKTKDVLVLIQHTMSSKVMVCWWSILKASNLQVEKYADNNVCNDLVAMYKSLEWKSITKPKLSNCILVCYPQTIPRRKKWHQFLDAYCKTHYYIELGPGPLAVGEPVNITFLINKTVPLPFRSWVKNRRPTIGNDWFIITAYNPHSKKSSEEENCNYNKALKECIVQKRLVYLEGIGQDPDLQWPGERHFLVFAPYEVGVELMYRFRQNAIVISPSISRKISKNQNTYELTDAPRLLFNNGFVNPIKTNKTVSKRRNRYRHPPLVSNDNEKPIKIVILGGGVASVSCIESILDIANEDVPASNCQVYLVTPSEQIQRLKKKRKLTNYLIKYEMVDENIEFLSQKGIKCVQDTAVGVDSELKQLFLKSGDTLSFDKLFIGTGAVPKLLFDSPFCLGVRDKASVVNLINKISKSNHIVVVGNGAIAMEMIAAASNMPLSITWILKDSYIGNTFFDYSAASFLQSRLWHNRSKFPKGHFLVSEEDRSGLLWKKLTKESDRVAKESDKKVQHGHSIGPRWQTFFHDQIGQIDEKKNANKPSSLNIEYNTSIVAYAGLETSAKYGFNLHLRLCNGSIIGCDYVISATGVSPNTSFLKEHGVKLAADGGVPVKLDTMVTDFSKDIYAGGDCCTVKKKSCSEHSESHWFQMRLWDQAMYMGKKAAHSMMDCKHKFYNSLHFDLFTHVTEAFNHKVVLIGRYNGQGMGSDYEEAFKSISLTKLQASPNTPLALSNTASDSVKIFIRCTPQREYIKVITVDNKVAGCILVGETDLDETFENLILSRINVDGIDLLNPDVDIEDYFD